MATATSPGGFRSGDHLDDELAAGGAYDRSSRSTTCGLPLGFRRRVGRLQDDPRVPRRTGPG